MKYLVLAFDGGGVKILLQWTILKRIIEKFPTFLDHVHVFAGTSAGSMLAGALAANKLSDVDNLINVDTITSVFSRSLFHKVDSMWGTIHAKYEHDNLKKILDKIFGVQKINELDRAVFIPSFAINAEDIKHADKHNEQSAEHITNNDSPPYMNCRCKRWHNVFFHNLREWKESMSIKNESETDIKCTTENEIKCEIKCEDEGCEHLKKNPEVLADAILKSGAAPYYFPIVGNCVDGGIAHNNPSMGVLTHLLALKIPIEDIYIFSLGSGEKPAQFEVKDDSSMGLLTWVPHLMDMIFDANMEACVHSCHEILGERFHRESPLMSKMVALDGYQDGELLIKMGEEADLTETFKWVDNFINEQSNC